jgi:hypothetical protein
MLPKKEPAKTTSNFLNTSNTSSEKTWALKARFTCHKKASSRLGWVNHCVGKHLSTSRSLLNFFVKSKQSFSSCLCSFDVLLIKMTESDTATNNSESFLSGNNQSMKSLKFSKRPINPAKQVDVRVLPLEPILKRQNITEILIILSKSAVSVERSISQFSSVLPSIFNFIRQH